MAAGHWEMAVDCLEKAIALFPDTYTDLATTEPLFAPLQQYPRFKLLITQYL
jgi:hypothetical protein